MRRRLGSWPARLCLLVAVLMIVRWMAVEPIRITSASMEPTLHQGDHVLVNKLAYKFDDPRRGDLVVFAPAKSGEMLAKRVVAVGGDRVGLEDGFLVVNGRRPDEPYVDHELVDSIYFGPVEVPKRSVFVMGDRRDNSEDSRALGPIRLDLVVGRVEARVWPVGRSGTL